MANSIKKVSETCFRALLDPLGPTETVTFTFDDATVPGDLVMSAPTWDPYTADGVVVGLQDAIQVEVIAADDDVTVAVPVSVIKTGTGHADFLITLMNDQALEGDTTPDLEIYITWGGH